MRIGSFVSTLRRFWENRRGAAALEFAIVGPLHLALMLGMLETGMVLSKSALLDIGTRAATKYVYVGAVANGSVELHEIKDEVCEYVRFLQPDCKDNLIVELTPMDGFTSPPDTDAKCQESSALEDIEPTVKFEGGAGTEIMFMRICLTMEIFFPGLGMGLEMTKSDTGKFEVISATAFQNEPF